MVASRNQMHVMSRAYGSTLNGSLEPYGAYGEMMNYLNGSRQVSMRGLGASPKPNFAPTTKGDVQDMNEVSTRFGWGAVFVIRDGQGYYVVEYYCPKSKSYRILGKYPTIDEAKASADKAVFSMRNSGVVSSISGLNGYAPIGQGGILSFDNRAMVASAILLYLGMDLPGARPLLKGVSRVLKEPQTAIMNGMMIVGLAGVTYSIVKDSAPGAF